MLTGLECMANGAMELFQGLCDKSPEVDDEDQVTKSPPQLTDVIGQEKSTEGSLDVMSMDEFGFTISVPVTSVTEKG